MVYIIGRHHGYRTTIGRQLVGGSGFGASRSQGLVMMIPLSDNNPTFQRSTPPKWGSFEFLLLSSTSYRDIQSMTIGLSTVYSPKFHNHKNMEDQIGFPFKYHNLWVPWKKLLLVPKNRMFQPQTSVVDHRPSSRTLSKEMVQLLKKMWCLSQETRGSWVSLHPSKFTVKHFFLLDLTLLLLVQHLPHQTFT